MRAFILIIVAVMLCLPEVAACQESDSTQKDPQFEKQRNGENPDQARIERDMARQRAKQRQQQLKDDTDKLLKLASELKQYVDKTNQDILSVDVLKKTDEIDKLAKSIRDKMKEGSYDGVKYPEVRGTSSQ